MRRLRTTSHIKQYRPDTQAKHPPLPYSIPSYPPDQAKTPPPHHQHTRKALTSPSS